MVPAYVVVDDGAKETTTCSEPPAWMTPDETLDE
jgi:hypothetical protein